MQVELHCTALDKGSEALIAGQKAGKQAIKFRPGVGMLQLILDLPDPFGPMSTLSGVSTTASLPGGKESNPSRRRDFRNCTRRVSLCGSGVGLVVEHRVPHLVPGVGAGAVVSQGLAAACV